jgi:uncharacterized protein
MNRTSLLCAQHVQRHVPLLARLLAPRLAAFALTALALGASAQGTASGATVAQAPSDAPKPAAATAAAAGKAAFREINWDDLLPKDWDPYKDLKDFKLAGLSDADPRAAAMLKRMREIWDNAPVNNQMDGQTVRIPGYIVPLEDSKAGLKEFLLVPYFGACIHTPPPPSNQIIHVLPRQGAKNFRSMDTVWVNGTLKTLRSDTAMGASSYRLDAVSVEPYSEKPK